MPTTIKRFVEERAAELQRARPECQLFNVALKTLADYLSIFSRLPADGAKYWFRGHGKLEYHLTPSALRHDTAKRRTAALRLISQFKRVAVTKLDSLPDDSDQLMWAQTARHYGLPTRLLDWTENAAIGLYFACTDLDSDGAVFLLNPVDLNRQVDSRRPRVFNAVDDSDLINEYLRLSGRQRQNGRKTIAIEPVWNSQRILLQRGVFTLHGDAAFTLGTEQASSLVFVPVRKQVKRGLLDELERIGIDEMSIFPEPDHACRHLVRMTELEA